MSQFPDKFMGVCRVNPEDPRASEQLSRWTEEHGFHGVRLSPATDASGDWFREPLMDPLFDRAAHLEVPVLILTKPPRLADLASILEHHGDVDVVIDHMADCPIDSPESLELLLDLVKYPRVYVKISHTWSLSSLAFPWQDTHEMVRRVYEAFGAERLMWGTDWPVCLGRATYAQALAVVRDEMSFLSAQDKEWILGKTALRLWPFS